MALTLDQLHVRKNWQPGYKVQDELIAYPKPQEEISFLEDSYPPVLVVSNNPEGLQASTRLDSILALSRWRNGQSRFRLYIHHQHEPEPPQPEMRIVAAFRVPFHVDAECIRYGVAVLPSPLDAGLQSVKQWLNHKSGKQLLRIGMPFLIDERPLPPLPPLPKGQTLSAIYDIRLTGVTVADEVEVRVAALGPDHPSWLDAFASLKVATATWHTKQSLARAKLYPPGHPEYDPKWDPIRKKLEGAYDHPRGMCATGNTEGTAVFYVPAGVSNVEARSDYLIAPRKEWLTLRDPLKPPQVKKAIINRGNWGVYYKYSFIMGKELGATQDHVAILLSNGRGQQPDTLGDQWELHQAEVLDKKFSVDGVFKEKVMGNKAYQRSCKYPERKWATLMKVIQLTVQGKTVQIEYMAPGGTYLPQRFIFYPFKAK